MRVEQGPRFSEVEPRNGQVLRIWDLLALEKKLGIPEHGRFSEPSAPPTSATLRELPLESGNFVLQVGSTLVQMDYFLYSALQRERLITVEETPFQFPPGAEERLEELSNENDDWMELAIRPGEVVVYRAPRRGAPVLPDGTELMIVDVSSSTDLDGESVEGLLVSLESDSDYRTGELGAASLFPMSRFLDALEGTSENGERIERREPPEADLAWYREQVEAKRMVSGSGLMEALQIKSWSGPGRYLARFALPELVSRSGVSGASREGWVQVTSFDDLQQSFIVQVEGHKGQSVAEFSLPYGMLLDNADDVVIEPTPQITSSDVITPPDVTRGFLRGPGDESDYGLYDEVAPVSRFSEAEAEWEPTPSEPLPPPRRDPFARPDDLEPPRIYEPPRAAAPSVTAPGYPSDLDYFSWDEPAFLGSGESTEDDDSTDPGISLPRAGVETVPVSRPTHEEDDHSAPFETFGRLGFAPSPPELPVAGNDGFGSQTRETTWPPVDLGYDEDAERVDPGFTTDDLDETPPFSFTPPPPAPQVPKPEPARVDISHLPPPPPADDFFSDRRSSVIGPNDIDINWRPPTTPRVEKAAPAPKPPMNRADMVLLLRSRGAEEADLRRKGKLTRELRLGGKTLYPGDKLTITLEEGRVMLRTMDKSFTPLAEGAVGFEEFKDLLLKGVVEISGSIPEGERPLAEVSKGEPVESLCPHCGSRWDARVEFCFADSTPLQDVYADGSIETRQE